MKVVALVWKGFEGLAKARLGVGSGKVAELSLVCCCALQVLDGLGFDLALACRFCSRSEADAWVPPAFSDARDDVNGASTSTLFDDESGGTVCDLEGSFSDCCIRFHHHKAYDFSDHPPSRRLCSRLGEHGISF